MAKYNKGFPVAGVKLEPKDKRNFKTGAVYNLPKPEGLPDDFELEFESYNQRKSDFCSAATTALMSGLINSNRPAFEYNMAVSKALSGDPDEWGQSPKFALKAGVEGGFIGESEAPFSLKEKSPDFLRRLNNWPDLKEKAAPNRMGSFFEVTGPYDHFDNIRSAIWRFREEKKAVGVPLLWKWPLEIPVISGGSGGGGHMVAITGWKTVCDGGEDKVYLIIRNSYGPTVGDNGRHYIPREIVNENVENWGAYIYNDLPKEVAKFLSDNKLSTKFTLVAKFVLWLKSWFN